MKRIWSLVLSVVIIVSLATVHHTARSATAVTFQVFYDSLSPYGQWIRDQRYGFVWIPAVDSNFHPYYSHGHWAMTQYGNTWISAYTWGWAAFHYGRWTYDPFYGWIWIPGQDWGPAWVNWRRGKDCYGWAPLMPDMVAGTASTQIKCPVNWWVFTPAVLIHDPHFHPYVYHRRKAARVLRRSSSINCEASLARRTSICLGPDTESIEEQTGHPAKVWALIQDAHPGRAEISDSGLILFHPKKILHVQKDAPSHSIEALQPITDAKPMPRMSFSEMIRDSYGHPTENFDTVKHQRNTKSQQKPRER